jgi:exodeoxyribonuclease VII large subunit
VADAIATAGSLDVDAVVVVRGGGSKTDLAAFDHERVATAIAHCRRPVVVGVGHEIDRSVADEVAHTSAKTPTAAASLLVSHVDEAVWRLESGSARLQALTELHLARARDRLIGNGGRLASAAGRATGRADVELTQAARRLRRSPALALERAETRLTMLDARRAVLDPEVALARGWTITRTAEGHLVRSVGDVTPGTELRTTTMDGMIDSRVVE